MRKKKAAAVNSEKHVCGECAIGQWVDVKEYPAHFDINWKPISMKCIFSKFLVLRSQQACPHFKERIKNN